jgi:hypothetical protein
MMLTPRQIAAYLEFSDELDRLENKELERWLHHNSKSRSINPPG